MTRTEKVRWRAIVAATILFAAADAFAQQPPAGGIDLESSPFAAPKPGQSQEPSSGLTPRGLNRGRLDWAPIASRCRKSAWPPNATRSRKAASTRRVVAA